MLFTQSKRGERRGVEVAREEVAREGVARRLLRGRRLRGRGLRGRRLRGRRPLLLPRRPRLRGELRRRGLSRLLLLQLLLLRAPCPGPVV